VGFHAGAAGGRSSPIMAPCCCMEEDLLQEEVEKDTDRYLAAALVQVDDGAAVVFWGTVSARVPLRLRGCHKLRRKSRSCKNLEIE
jgi:hypothetical protein